MEKNTKKITDKQLEALQEKLKMIDGMRLQVGTLENQKFMYLNQMALVQKELQDMQKELEDEYGKVTIDVATGAIKELEEDEKPDTKN
tara:strand:+ start:1163 stop:1426 length:264 start_codon:yes stop_codon:yes gene_type:complete